MITTYEQLPLFLTVEELATTLKIGKTTAYQLVRSDRIKSYRAGNQYRIPKESLRNLCAESAVSFR